MTPCSVGSAPVGNSSVHFRIGVPRWLCIAADPTGERFLAGITLDNLYDWDQETNQLMEGEGCVHCIALHHTLMHCWHSDMFCPWLAVFVCPDVDKHAMWHVSQHTRVWRMTAPGWAARGRPFAASALLELSPEVIHPPTHLVICSTRPAGLQRDRDAKRVQAKTSSNQQFLRWEGSLCVGGWVGAGRSGNRADGCAPAGWALPLMSWCDTCLVLLQAMGRVASVPPSCACRSEWRVGNEFYRQIQRTGGGLVSLCCPCWSSCCCCHGVHGRNSSWESVWALASTAHGHPGISRHATALHAPMCCMWLSHAHCMPPDLSTPQLSRRRHLRATASCACAVSDRPFMCGTHSLPQRVQGECFELVQLAFQAHMTQVGSPALPG